MTAANNDRPHHVDAEAARYWERNSRRFSQIHPRLVLLKEMLMESGAPIRNVLDVGCGPGAMGTLLGEAVEYFGCDIAEGIISEFRSPRFEVVDFNIMPDCFGNKRFDAVICSGAFEYAKNPTEFAAFLARKVKAGGVLALSYNNRQHYHTLLRRSLGRGHGYLDPQFNFLTVAEAVKVLRAAGFTLSLYRSITRAFRSPPLCSQFIHFPLNVFGRQFLFVLKRT